MSAAKAFDARDGITAAALDELRQADSFALAFLNSQTAVLGYWIAGPDSLEAPQQPSGTVVLHGRSNGADLPSERFLRRHWRTIWKQVSPGDVPRVVVVAGAATLAIAPPRDWARTQPFGVFRPPRRQPPPAPPGEEDAA